LEISSGRCEHSVLGITHDVVKKFFVEGGGSTAVCFDGRNLIKCFRGNSAEFCKAVGLEKPLACPICQKRKAKRFCPAKGESICSVCCGTEREVSIDCPSDCLYLMASRRVDEERRKIDWSKIPFPDQKIPSSFARTHEKLLNALVFSICGFARDNSSLADSDVIATTTALAEAFQTLTKGIYYEKRPPYALQAGLYEAMKTTLRDLQKAEATEAGFPGSHDGDIRDALIVLAQLGAIRENGRPRSRAFLDFLRRQMKPQELPKSASNLVLP
jgi:hypothetical protein